MALGVTFVLGRGRLANAGDILRRRAHRAKVSRNLRERYTNRFIATSFLEAEELPRLEWWQTIVGQRMQTGSAGFNPTSVSPHIDDDQTATIQAGTSKNQG
jgi:hypothetical protein